jgi:hypothetical protein
VAHCGTFSFQFEDDHTRIVSGSQKILSFVRRKDPESIALSSEGLDANSLANIPYTDTAILTVGNNQIVLGVEQAATNVVGMPSKSVNFPCLRFTHAPQFDLTVIGRTCQEW